MDMSRSIDRKVKSRRRGFRSPKLSRSDPGQWVSLFLGTNSRTVLRMRRGPDHVLRKLEHPSTAIRLKMHAASGTVWRDLSSEVLAIISRRVRDDKLDYTCVLTAP